MRLFLSRFCVLAVILLLSLTVQAQAPEEFKPIRMSIRTSFGYTGAFSPLKKGYLTDNLIASDKHTAYGEFVSGNYYFNAHFGVELTVSASYSDHFTQAPHKFDGEIERVYGGNYFVLPDSYNPSPDNMDFVKVYTGPTYKIELNRVVLIGRLLFGVVSIATNNETVFLKEKNTNEYLQLDFESRYPADESFIFNPSFSVGYRIYKRIMLSADFNYSVYKPGINYTFRTTRMTTREVTSIAYRYNTVVQELSVGLGVHVILWQK